MVEIRYEKKQRNCLESRIGAVLSAMLVATTLMAGSMCITGCSATGTDNAKVIESYQDVFDADDLNQPEMVKYGNQYYTVNIAGNALLVLDENLNIMSEPIVELLYEEEQDNRVADSIGYSVEMTSKGVLEIRHNKKLVYSYDRYEGMDAEATPFIKELEVYNLAEKDGILYFILADYISWDLFATDLQGIEYVLVGDVYSYNIATGKMNCLAMDYQPKCLFMGKDALYAWVNTRAIDGIDLDTDPNAIMKYDIKSGKWSEVCKLEGFTSFNGYTPPLFAQNPNAPEYLRITERADSCIYCNINMPNTNPYAVHTLHELTNQAIFHIMGRPVGENFNKREYHIPYVLTEEEFEFYKENLDVEDDMLMMNSYIGIYADKGIFDKYDGDMIIDRYPSVLEGRKFVLSDCVTEGEKEKLEEIFASQGYDWQKCHGNIDLDKYSNDEYGMLYIQDPITLAVKKKVQCPLYIYAWLGSNVDDPIALVNVDGYKLVKLDYAEMKEGRFGYAVLLDGLDEVFISELIEAKRAWKLMYIDGELIYRQPGEDFWYKVKHN